VVRAKVEELQSVVVARGDARRAGACCLLANWVGGNGSPQKTGKHLGEQSNSLSAEREAV